MIPLKYNTASQEIPLGPFVDSTDGDTEETGLTIANTDIKLWKSGATSLVNKNSGGATHMANGEYYCTLDATDTNTYGPLKIRVHVSGALAVQVYCIVMEADAYDALYAAAGTGHIEADAVQISGDAQAADNLELMYDGTGYTDDTAPASRAQVGSIAVGAGGISTIATSGSTVTTGTETLTYTATEQLDGTTHDVAADAGNTELMYEFSVGSSGICTEVVWDGYAQSNGDSYTVNAYDWISASYKQIGTITGTNGSSIGEHVFTLTAAMTGTGANIGLVRFQLTSSTGTEIFTDRVLAQYTQASAGIANGSTVTLSASAANDNLIGRGWTLALGGQSITGAYIFQSTNVSGTGTGANGSPYIFQECQMTTVTLDAYGFLEKCAINGTLTLASTGGVTADSISFFNCFSGVAGSGSPTITAAGVTKTTNVQTRNWFGGITAVLTSDCVWSHEVVSGGTQTFTNNGGSLELRGAPKAVALTTTGSGTSNIIVGNGCPITIAGTGGTVNLYGFYGDVTDSSSGTTVNYLGQDATELADVLADTNELQGDWANGGRLDLILDARASQTTADAIETDTQDIQTRIPAALNNGAIPADVQRVNNVKIVGNGSTTPFNV